jgi:RNA polymerase sigma-70 factor (ECF subfamily)
VPKADQIVEARLLEAAQTGDTEAFEVLQLLLEQPVRRFIRRLIGLSDAEDDIVQDAFLALYLNLDRIRSGDKLRPFLFRVVRNRSYDELRALGRFQHVPLEPDSSYPDGGGVIPDDGLPPDEVTHWRLVYAEVQAAIENLPEQQRQTLILYGEEHLAYAEIAEVMNTSVGTVKSRLFHARQTLRRMLRPDILQTLGIERAWAIPEPVLVTEP